VAVEVTSFGLFGQQRLLYRTLTAKNLSKIWNLLHDDRSCFFANIPGCSAIHGSGYLPLVLSLPG
jgi:hypothetical protein